MKTTFIKNFEGTSKRPTTIDDLRRCVQEEHESTELLNSSTDMSSDVALFMFEENCKFEPLVQKINQARKNIKTVSDLMEIASRYSEADKTKDVSNKKSTKRRMVAAKAAVAATTAVVTIVMTVATISRKVMGT
jgi:hypothetical protein